jgi:hypothetical protein
MEAPRIKPKRVPRKQLFVNQIDQLLKLSEANLKVWLYHYRREGGGDGRKSWASRDTVGEATGFSRPTISHARTWLVANGWLAVVGYRENHHGGSPVREYRCLFPESQGKASGTMKTSQGKASGTPQSKASDPSRVKPAAPEVRTPLEVTAQAPIPCEVILTTNSFGESVSRSVSYEEPATFKDPYEDRPWLQFMADPQCAELYNQVGVHGGLALVMGLDYFGDEHIPLLHWLTKWAHQYKKDVGYLKGIWLWSQSHKFWKTRVLGLDSMVKAMGNQTEKGLVAQYNRIVAKQKTKAANGNGHAPLWVHKKHDDGTTVRSLGRKPVTSMERDELIDMLQQPKINREYVLGFLVQDNCPECRGQDIGCECCVLTSEVLPAPPVAPAPPDCSHARVAEDGNTCLDCGSVRGAKRFGEGV